MLELSFVRAQREKTGTISEQQMAGTYFKETERQERLRKKKLDGTQAGGGKEETPAGTAGTNRNQLDTQEEEM